MLHMQEMQLHQRQLNRATKVKNVTTLNNNIKSRRRGGKQQKKKRAKLNELVKLGYEVNPHLERFKSKDWGELQSKVAKKYGKLAAIEKISNNKVQNDPLEKIQ